MLNLQSRKNVVVWILAILTLLLTLIGSIYYSSFIREGEDHTMLPDAVTQDAVTRVFISSYSVQPDDLLALAQKVDLVVEGTIKEVQPAIWTTPDGAAPNDPQFVNNPDIQLRTPFLISIAQIFRGHITSNELLFTMEGGTTPTYQVMRDDKRSLTVGDRVVIFINKAPTNAGSWAKISPYFPEYYFIVHGDELIGSQHNITRLELDRQLLSLKEDK